jgi:hypothetical protein
VVSDGIISVRSKLHKNLSVGSKFTVREEDVYSVA